MLSSATVSLFRLTCSCCPAVNLTGSVTSRQLSWTGQQTAHTSLAHHRLTHLIMCTSFNALCQYCKVLCMCVFCRETNMKVRQSVSVTCELGDPNNLAAFNGEIQKQYNRHHSPHSFVSKCFFSI